MGQAGAFVPDLPRAREALVAGRLLPLPPRPPAAGGDATVPMESPELVPAPHAPSFHSAMQSGLVPHQTHLPSGSWCIWCGREKLMLQEHVRRTATPGKVSLFFPATMSPCCPLPAATILATLARSPLGKGDRDDAGTPRSHFGWFGSISSGGVFAMCNNSTDCSRRTALPHTGADPAPVTPSPQSCARDTVPYCSRCSQHRGAKPHTGGL